MKMRLQEVPGDIEISPHLRWAQPIPRLNSIRRRSWWMKAIQAICTSPTWKRSWSRLTKGRRKKRRNHQISWQVLANNRDCPQQNHLWPHNHQSLSWVNLNHKQGKGITIDIKLVALYSIQISLWRRTLCWHHWWKLIWYCSKNVWFPRTKPYFLRQLKTWKTPRITSDQP